MGISSQDYGTLANSSAQTMRGTADLIGAISSDRERERQNLMDRIKFDTSLGDTDRNKLKQQLDNGFGIVGGIKNLLGMGQGYSPVSNESQLANTNNIQSQYQPTDITDKLVGLVKGHNTADLAQAKILNDPSLSQEQKAMIVAGRGKNIEDVNQFQNDYRNEGTENTGMYKSNLDNQVNDIKSFSSDQMPIDKQNKLIEKQNSKIISDAQKQDEINKQLLMPKKGSLEYYSGHLNDNGLTMPSQWEGSFAKQTGDALNVYKTLVDKAVSEGDMKSADKFNREYNANMKSIYKNWGEKYDPNENNLFITGKGAKDPIKTYPIKAVGKDGTETTVDVEMPQSIAMIIGTEKGRKWLEQNAGFTKNFSQGQVNIASSKEHVNIADEANKGRDWEQAVRAVTQGKAEFQKDGTIAYKGNNKILVTNPSLKDANVQKIINAGR